MVRGEFKLWREGRAFYSPTAVTRPTTLGDGYYARSVLSRPHARVPPHAFALTSRARFPPHAVSHHTLGVRMNNTGYVFTFEFTDRRYNWQRGVQNERFRNQTLFGAWYLDWRVSSAAQQRIYDLAEMVSATFAYFRARARVHAYAHEHARAHAHAHARAHAHTHTHAHTHAHARAHAHTHTHTLTLTLTHVHTLTPTPTRSHPHAHTHAHAHARAHAHTHTHTLTLTLTLLVSVPTDRNTHKCGWFSSSLESRRRGRPTSTSSNR